jgi:hypothetical protein
MLSRMKRNERTKMNGVVRKVNEIYRKVVDRCVNDSGDRSKLTSEFESWFD